MSDSEKRDHWTSLADQLGMPTPVSSQSEAVPLTVAPVPVKAEPETAAISPTRESPTRESPTPVSKRSELGQASEIRSPDGSEPVKTAPVIEEAPTVPASPAVSATVKPRRGSHWNTLANLLGLGGLMSAPEPEPEPEPVPELLPPKGMGVTASSRQPPDSNRQPPDTNRQPPDTNRQPPDTNRQPPDSGLQTPDSGLQTPASSQRSGQHDRRPRHSDRGGPSRGEGRDRGGRRDQRDMRSRAPETGVGRDAEVGPESELPKIGLPERSELDPTELEGSRPGTGASESEGGGDHVRRGRRRRRGGRGRGERGEHRRPEQGESGDAAVRPKSTEPPRRFDQDVTDETREELFPDDRDVFVDEGDAELSTEPAADLAGEPQAERPERTEDRDRTGRRRRRRRGRRGRGDGSRSEDRTTGEPAEGRPPAVRGDSERLVPEEAPGAAEDPEGIENLDERSTETRRHRDDDHDRHRRRRRRPEGRGDERAADRPAARPSARPAPEARREEPPGDDDDFELDDFDLDDQEAGGEAQVGDSGELGEGDRDLATEGEIQSAHRGIPTWTETIGQIITTNMEARAKNPAQGHRGRGPRQR